MAAEVISLVGRSILVTGGGRGLGRAMVEALAGAGASVLAVDLDPEPLDELKAAVSGDVVGCCADVTDLGDVHRAVESAIEAFGHLDMVVNNAGIGMSSLAISEPAFYEIDDEVFRRFFEVHVLGSFNVSKAALPHLRSSASGRIVTVTTSTWFMLFGHNTPYGPVKAAMEALASAMHHDLEDTTVTVNVLVPGGAADTRFVRTEPGESRDTLIKPSVMGAPIVFLASEQSDGVSGRRIIANDWDCALVAREALARCSAPIGWPADH